MDSFACAQNVCVVLRLMELFKEDTRAPYERRGSVDVLVQFSDVTLPRKLTSKATLSASMVSGGGGECSSQDPQRQRLSDGLAKLENTH